MRLTWLGHSACHLEVAGKSLLIDPFFTGNPKFPTGHEERIRTVDFILMTHGHEDHGIGDAARLAKHYGATVIAQPEVLGYLGGQGVEQVEPMNVGGTVEREGLAFTMTHAQHSSSVMEGSRPIYMGNPAGFVIRSTERTVYHAGDTGLFSDMALIERLYAPRVGLIPIGDRFTMGPDTAAIACNEYLALEDVLPIHYGTFGLLTGEPADFEAAVTRGRVHLPAPGATLDL